ncbi:uncharacterized protein [Clytia hemisphaerica]|uniref:uncharacterized protein n=1 Tax=Clytia hemisphaerica TaxID=252671 RepID=UPI0034D7786C
MDGDGWKRILASRNYGTFGSDLRTSLANMLKILCRTHLDPLSEERNIEAYLACRLVPLDKSPGVRPIGIGEVLRRIFGKTLIRVIKKDIMKAAGSLQVCAEQQAGSEAAMDEIFAEEGTDTILLVDASNAFNTLKRDAFLLNIKLLCPALSTYITNCYCRNSRIFVTGGSELVSSEGTTQGDPMAMPTYAIGLVSLLDLLKEDPISCEVKEAAFADDLAGGGKLDNLLKGWTEINRAGPCLGYYPKASKSWLIVKEEKLQEAKDLFEGTNIKITSDGRKYLGGSIGTDEFKTEYLESKVQEWIEEIKTLADIAKSQPHCAYSAFVRGIIHKFTYHIRVLKDISPVLQPLDQAIDQYLIPALTEGHICSPTERKLLSLPVKLGGLEIPILSDISDVEHSNFLRISESLKTDIVNQRKELNVNGNGNGIKYKVMREKDARQKLKLEEIRSQMSAEELKANDLAQAKGASNWLTALPLQNENFTLTKREFYDAIAIRYRWQLKHLPTHCACGKPYTVEHLLSCTKGGFIY